MRSDAGILVTLLPITGTSIMRSEFSNHDVASRLLSRVAVFGLLPAAMLKIVLLASDSASQLSGIGAASTAKGSLTAGSASRKSMLPRSAGVTDAGVSSVTASV